MTFEPGLPRVIDMIDDAAAELVTVASSFLRVITMRSMRQYLEPATLALLEHVSASNKNALGGAFSRTFSAHHGGGSELKTLNSIRTLVAPASNENVAAVPAAIHTVIENNYADAYADAKVLLPLLEIFSFGAAWDPKAYSGNTPDTDAALFRADLARTSKWVLDVSRMRKISVVGMFRVDSTRLKLQLVPIPGTVLKDMKESLSGCAQSSCERSLNSFLETRSKLLRKPDSLKAFAEFVDFVRTIKASASAMEGSAANVDALYDLMRTYNVEIDIPNRILIEELDSVREAFSGVLAEAERYVASRVDEMSGSLDKHISSLESHVVSVLSDLYVGNFVDPDADTSAVLDELAMVETSLKSAKSKADTYTKWQELFDVSTPHEYASLAEAMEVHAMRKTIWSSLEGWNVALDSWKTSPFVSLSTADIKTEVNASYAAAYKLSHKLPDDPVVAVWKASALLMLRKPPPNRRTGKRLQSGHTPAPKRPLSPRAATTPATAVP